MARVGGHPPNPTASSVDPVVMSVARELLDELAPSHRATRVAPPGKLRRAVLAARLSEAFEVLSVDAVTDARDGDEPVTWAEVGDAFGIRAQSAQGRFRR